MSAGPDENPRQADDVDPVWEPGIFGFTAAKRSTYAGTTLLTLDHPHLLVRAVEESTRALQAYQHVSEVERSGGDILAAHLDLASAHHRTDDLDAAHTHLRVVTQAPADRRTASITARLLRLVRDLADTPAGCSALGRQMLESSRAVLSDRPRSLRPYAHEEHLHDG
ncbi:MAG: hypothetical protein GXX79_01170 [Actinomycetales bacterium]|nr:hypothetical protein [Actinomycetales bacterium]